MVGSVGTRSAHGVHATESPLQYVACTVKAVDEDRLPLLLANPDYGITEKENGERCIVVWDLQNIYAYNRKGKLMSAPPEGAQQLRGLACPCVIDGEQLTGDLAGTFVAFHLLEWNSEPYTAFPYSQCMLTLAQAMLAAGLIWEAVPTPTFQLARANSRVEGLVLLTPVSGLERATRTFEAVQAASGEGVVFRSLSGDYAASPFKFKFVTDIDVFVWGINDGLSGGSLKLGLVRHTDQAVISVGNVRACRNESETDAVRAMLDKGGHPVFTVTYLPKRTVGIRLVEPRTGMAMLRSDKDAAECTTEQFGSEKADAIEQAEPLTGISLS
jgi:ATP-dependent DNA ligase